MPAHTGCSHSRTRGPQAGTHWDGSRAELAKPLMLLRRPKSGSVPRTAPRGPQAHTDYWESQRDIGGAGGGEWGAGGASGDPLS